MPVEILIKANEVNGTEVPVSQDTLRNVSITIPGSDIGLVARINKAPYTTLSRAHHRWSNGDGIMKQGEDEYILTLVQSPHDPLTKWKIISAKKNI